MYVIQIMYLICKNVDQCNLNHVCKNMEAIIYKFGF